MLKYSLVAFVLLWSVAHATPTGNHTCTGVVKHEVTVRVNVTEPVTYRAYEWCLRVPPRCSTYTVQLKERIKVQREMHNRTITVCCKGYVEIDYKCVPACPPNADCPNMHCNRTNHCYCTPGYTGLYCNDPCPKGVWGAGCIKQCDCPAGYTCHHLTGDCMIDDSPPTKTRRTTTAETTTNFVTTMSSKAQPTTAAVSTDRPTPRIILSTRVSTTTERLTTEKTSTTAVPTFETHASTLPTVGPTTERTTLPTTIAVTTTTTTTTTQPPTTTPTSTTTTTATPSTTTFLTPVETTLRTTTTTTPSPTTPPAASTAVPTTPTTTQTPTSVLTTPSTVQLPTTITVTWPSILKDQKSTSLAQDSTKHVQFEETTSYRSTATPSTVDATITTVATTSEKPHFETVTHKTPISWVSPPPTTVAIEKWDVLTPSRPKLVHTVSGISETELTTTQSIDAPLLPSTPISDRQQTPSTTPIVPTAPEATQPSPEVTRGTMATTTTSSTPITQIQPVTTSTTRIADHETWAATSSAPPASTKQTEATSRSTEPPPTTQSTLFKTQFEPSTRLNEEFVSLKTFNEEATFRTDNSSEKRMIFESTLPKSGATTDQTSTHTHDQMVVEDIAQTTESEEHPIKIVEEVIAKYFPETFLKITEGPPLTTKASVSFESERKETDYKRIDNSRVGKIEEPQSHTSTTILSSSAETTSTKSVENPPLTKLSTTGSSSTPLTSSTGTFSPITPRFIVSAKNPDEIDFGGIIFRKMKLFPPEKVAEEATAFEPQPILTTPSESTIHKFTSDDRFKLYLPKYEEELGNTGVSTEPPLKTVLPKLYLEKDDVDTEKQYHVKKAKPKEKEQKKYKVKSQESTLAPHAAEDGTLTTNNVLLETKEFKVHLESTKPYRNREPFFTAPPEHPSHDINEVGNKKDNFEVLEEVKLPEKTESRIEFEDDRGVTKAVPVTETPTTNSKAPHTWYSHAKEKERIKNALKAIKSTTMLERAFKPTGSSILEEESNDIHSMVTEYNSEREARSAQVESGSDEEDLNNPQLFEKIRFAAPESYSSSMERTGVPRDSAGFVILMAITGICLTGVMACIVILGLRARRRVLVDDKMSEPEEKESRKDISQTPNSFQNYETVYPLTDPAEVELATFFCPTFTNNYAERINREFREMSYDHPRSSYAEPYYEEICKSSPNKKS